VVRGAALVQSRREANNAQCKILKRAVLRLTQSRQEHLPGADRYCRMQHDGKPFAQLTDDEKDKVIADVESGEAKLDGVDGRIFIDHLIKDIQEGFFADPIYGGNRDMVAWKMIGFPGARYNYLHWIDRHNERYPLPPVSIMGRTECTPKGS
jgi:gluconate 2-dehydrogenase gamma chain